MGVIFLSLYFLHSFVCFSTDISYFYSGGGWTLVVSISSKNNDHLQRNSNNCLNSVLCVPTNESVITARKLSDTDIHKLSMAEGRQITENEYSMFHYNNRCGVHKRKYVFGPTQVHFAARDKISSEKGQN